MVSRIKAGKSHDQINPTVQDFISALSENAQKAYRIYKKFRERDFIVLKTVMDALEPYLPDKMRIIWKTVEGIYDELAKK